ncbi:MAG: hypothetical protein IJ775_02965 [Muribaculaceae bacterium]|nr:hypothetical protein [Muribaculaceae bacterium]
MKKIFTLCLLAGALMAQAKVYTLADLATIVGTLENTYEKNGETITETVGVTVDGNVYTITIPTGLAEGVDGIGYDDNNIILSKSYLTLVEGNDLTINAGETLLFAGAAQLEMSGKLTAYDAVFGAAEGSEGTAKGFRLYGDNASVGMGLCEFDYVGMNFGSTNGHLIMDQCDFIQHNAKSGNSAINFTSSCDGNSLTTCTFTNCQLSGVASGANVGVGIEVQGCQFKRDFAVNRLYPHINLSLAGDYTVDIHDNLVEGAYQTCRTGGIAVSNLLGASYTGTVYIRNNYVAGNSYGITLTGGGNVVIENNDVIDNKYIANAVQGGSGINITCNAANSLAKAYIRGNRIEGNLWGVTVIGNVDINAGKTEDPTAEDYNPGENFFVNNGNGGVLYDWYNNTTATSYAQGNYWNVDEQTEEKIETVIFHQKDDATLGEVIYMPPYEDPTAITDVKADASTNGDNRYYNIMGQPVAHPTTGIYIHNGRKVVVK